jgi:hypothetical protein
MGQIEDDGIELEDTDVEPGEDPEERGERKGPDKSMTFRDQSTRALQRARKSVADGEATPMTGYLVQAATVWAILDLAEAFRESRQG